MGGKCGIISKLRNDINVPDGTFSSKIRGIMKEVSLAKEDGVKVEPNLKGWSKTGRKSIIHMNYQGLHIIADTVEAGTSTLNEWSLVNNNREVKELPLIGIFAFGTYIDKLKPLVENMKNEK